MGGHGTVQVNEHIINRNLLLPATPLYHLSSLLTFTPNYYLCLDKQPTFTTQNLHKNFDMKTLLKLLKSFREQPTLVDDLFMYRSINNYESFGFEFPQ